MLRTRSADLLLLAVLLSLVAAPIARAQSVGDAVSDLRSHGVTFEDGALTNQEIAQLDALAGRSPTRCTQPGDGSPALISRQSETGERVATC